MTIVCPNGGEILLLQYILNFGATNGDKVLHLYGSDVTPSDTTTIGGGAGQLAESSEAGYSAITLTGNWTTAQTGGGITSGTYATQEFTFSTNANVYGYYVTSLAASTDLLWCERFTGAPFALPTGGGTIQITPQIELA